MSDFAHISSLPPEVIEQCAYWNDPNCSTGFPIVIYAAGDLDDHSEHIYSAQIGLGNTINRIDEGFSSSIDAFLSKRVGRWQPDQWYNSTPYCNNEARGNYLDLYSRIPACDEYPFASTWQGGPVNYGYGEVSLKLVSQIESRLQGKLMGQFYSSTGVIANDPILSWFGVITMPYTQVNSFWITRNGDFGSYR